MTLLVFKILASVAGVYASYFISKKLAGWIQAWQNRKQKTEATDVRVESQTQNQKANAEGDVLRDIDGR